MSRQGLTAAVVVAVVLAALVPHARAEITSITGFTQAEVTEYIAGSPGDTDRATESFPTTSASLPIQVLAQLLSDTLSDEAAAAVAAQFADPRDLDQPNPEEFAINLTLNSVSDQIHYEGSAISRETRGVLFSAGELGSLTSDGDAVEVTGRLFVDGALAIFAVNPQADLTDAYVTLSLTVVKVTEGQDDETVFSGEIQLSGTTGGEVTLSSAGSFPTGLLVLTDLSLIADEFDAFNVLIIPNLQIDYTYDAVVGEPFTLQAAVEVSARNVPDESGVAAIIGTPTDTLAQVIGLTMGEQVAGKTITALTNERENPSGQAAFPETSAPGGLLFPACGLFGFEGLFAFAAVAGMRRFGISHTSTRK